MYDMKNIKKLAQIKTAAPDAMRGFETFDAAALKDGAIPKKYKELMALAVALTTQCPYCLEIHRGAAIKVGRGERRAGGDDLHRSGAARRRRRHPWRTFDGGELNSWL